MFCGNVPYIPSYCLEVVQMTRIVRIQKLEALVAMCKEYLLDEKPSNGTKTLFSEIIQILEGKLKTVRGENNVA
jgi:hypothetical protein